MFSYSSARAKMKYNPDTDIPDLSGKVILLTGGTDGIGKETIIALAKHSPTKIYLAARSPEKAKTTLAEITSKIGPTCVPIEYLELDLSSLSSVQQAARTFLAKEDRLDVLICNAASFAHKGLTKDGYEIAFGTNHLGHFLLTSMLMPTMLATAKHEGVQKGDTRVVIVASDGERYANKETYTYDLFRTDLGAWGFLARYGQSKLANVHTARVLAEKYPESESGVRFISLHPGEVRSNLGSGAIGWPRVEKAVRLVAGVALGLMPTEQGAWNSLWAATWPSGKEGEPASGEHYHPVGVEGKGSERAYNRDMAREIYAWTEKELKPWMEA